MEPENDTLFDYLAWRGDLPLTAVPFGEADNLLLSVLSYLDLSGVPGAGSKNPENALPLSGVIAALPADTPPHQRFRMVPPEDILRLATEASRAPRFQGTRLFAYECLHDEHSEMQFSAVTFLLPDGSAFLSFRGTDNTLVGWKEDFNMSFLSEVPAQTHAAAYAREILRACGQGVTVRLGGHSKGGNLAVWAAVHTPLPEQARIAAAYSNDGPGYSADVIRSEEYQRMSSRIHTFLPESSVVGMLLEHEEGYTIIASHQKAFLQHAPLSWQIRGGSLLHLEERSAFGRHTDTVVKEWLRSLSREEREGFSDTLFQVLGLGRAKTLSQIMEPGFLSGAAAIFRSYTEISPDNRKMLTGILHRLGEDVRKELKRSAGRTEA